MNLVRIKFNLKIIFQMEISYRLGKINKENILKEELFR
jgi:hypothetical protein